MVSKEKLRKIGVIIAASTMIMTIAPLNFQFDTGVHAEAAERASDMTKRSQVLPRPTITGKIGKVFIQHPVPSTGLSVIAQVPVKGLPNTKVIVNGREYMTNSSGFVEIPLFHKEGEDFDMYQINSAGDKSPVTHYHFVDDVDLIDLQLTTDIKAGDTFVTGIGTPGATVTIRKGSATPSIAIVGANGEFRVSIPAYSGVNDSVMFQTLGDAYSREVPLDKNKLVPMTVFDVPSADSELVHGNMVLMGKATPWTDLEIRVNGQLVSSAYTHKDGFFNANTPKQNIGTDVSITQVSRTGLRETKVVKVVDKSKNSIKFTNYTFGSSYLNGTYTGSVVRTRIYSGSKVYPSAGTFTNGTFRYYFGGDPISNINGPIYRFLEGYDVNNQIVAIFGKYM